MASDFYCIYSGNNFSDTERSVEHIVPYSIGGSNSFTIYDVSKKANNDAGSRIDAQLVNSWFVSAERWRLGIKSQGGDIPPVLMEGTIEVNGHVAKATYAINHDQSVELITIPEVNCDWASGKIKINCDPKDLPTIVANIDRKAKRKGFSLSKDQFQDLDGKVIKVENPELKGTMSFNMHAFVPCFLKMALATGHRVFGYSWSKNSDAAAIRKAMWEADHQKLEDHRIKGSIWPNCQAGSLKQILNVGTDKHLLMVLNTGPVSFYAVLFGKFEGMIQLQDGVWNGPELPIDDGRIFVIDCKTRKLDEMSFGQFLLARNSGSI